MAFSVTVLVSLLVCLIPTTIGGLLSAIGIAGIDRMVQNNVLAMSGHAVEAAGDVDVLLLDKTGTITLGNREATEFIPAPGVEPQGTGRGRPAFQPGRRNARRPQHRGPGQGAVRHPRPGNPRAAARRVRPLHRPDPHERRRHQRPQRSARAPPTASASGSAARFPRKSTRPSRTHQPRRRHAAGRRHDRTRPWA